MRSTLILLMTGLLASGLTGQVRQDGNISQPRRPMRVSIDIHGESEEYDRELTQIYRDQLLLELKLAGFVSGRASDADVRIEGEYSLAGDLLLFSLRAETTADGRELFTVTESAGFGPGLDQALIHESRRLVAALVRYRDERDEFTAGESEADETRSGRRLLAELGVGAYLVGGESGAYLSGGVRPVLTVGYRLTSALSVGLAAELITFDARGYLNSAEGLVLTVAPEIRYLMQRETGPEPGVRAAAGAALVSLVPEGDDRMNKFTPAGSAGVFVRFPLRSLKLRLFLDVAVMYENFSLLYGFSPGMGIQW